MNDGDRPDGQEPEDSDYQLLVRVPGPASSGHNYIEPG
jgi:hypothetical protein